MKFLISILKSIFGNNESFNYYNNDIEKQEDNLDNINNSYVSIKIN